MERDQYLATIETNGTAFLDACLRAGLTAPVPPCPGWTVADLLYHLLEVHNFWRRMVDAAAQNPDDIGDELPRPADDALANDFRAGLDDLLRVLGDADLALPVWTWSDDQTAGFVLRRMAQETVIHRWDAEMAAGSAEAIDAEIASDGIDEFLFHFLGGPVGTELSGSVHIHCTDVAGEWTTRPHDDVSVTTREHAKGDCALRGPASDLLLVLWRRAPITAVDVVGDEAVAAQFLAWSPLV